MLSYISATIELVRAIEQKESKLACNKDNHTSTFIAALFTRA